MVVLGLVQGGGGGLSCRCIPDNCHFFYTDKIFGAKNLHPNARKSGQIGFHDIIA